MATEYLQAIDMGGTVVAGGQGLADRINSRVRGADARVAQTVAATVGRVARETGVPDATAYLIAYEGAAVRNTTVNNIAYGAGFISNNTTLEQFERTYPGGRRAAAGPAAAATGNS